MTSGTGTPTHWWDEFEAAAKEVGCLLPASWWAAYETKAEAAASLADHLERHAWVWVGAAEQETHE